MAGAAPGTTLVWTSSAAKLRAVASQSFFFYWPETAGCSFQMLQTFQTPRNMPYTGSWSCQTIGAVASQVFLFLLSLSFLLARNCQMLSWSCEIRVCGKSQIFLFLLARNCRMLPSNAPNCAPNSSKCAKPALGAAKLRALASQVVPFLLLN